MPKGATIVGNCRTHGDYSVTGSNGEVVGISNPSGDDFNGDGLSRRGKEVSALTTLKKECRRSCLGTSSGKVKFYTVMGGTCELQQR